MGPTCAMHRTSARTVRTPANGTPAIASPDPGDRRLADRGDDHSERHAADRLAREHDRRGAAVPAHAAREAAQPVGGGVAEVVEDGGHDHRHQELREERPDAAERGEKPVQGLTRVRRGLRREIPHPLAREALPRGGCLRTDERDLGDPCRRGRNIRRFEAGRPWRRLRPGARGASRGPRGTAPRRRGGARSSGRPPPGRGGRRRASGASGARATSRRRSSSPTRAPPRTGRRSTARARAARR